MKKILILGVGDAQLDLIRFCKEAGYVVHTCSYRHEGRGIEESDFFHLVNITDVTAVTDLAINYGIDKMYSIGSDLAMPTVAAVTGALGLKSFIDYKTATICNNKPLLRDALYNINDGEYSVRYKLLSNKDDIESWNVFPAIVKPAVSQGQRGISLVKQKNEMKEAFSKASNISNNRLAIAEEYVDGFEISINSYILNGMPMFLFLTERISFPQYPGGIIKSHRYPISKTFNDQKINKMVADTCNQLNIKEGPVYYQIKINSNGEPRIIEITPRLDGCHLWRLLRLVGGPDLLKIILKYLSNERIDNNDFKFEFINSEKKADLTFFTQPPDKIMDRNNFSADDHSKYLEWYYHDGEAIRTVNGYQEKVGYQIKIY